MKTTEQFKEEINAAISIASENLVKDRKAYEAATNLFKLRQHEEEEPIRKLLKEYYDNELKDCMGTPIQALYVIKNKKGGVFAVLDRGMQFLFGTPMFNPKVEAKVIANGKLGYVKRSFGPSELAGMVVIHNDYKAYLNTLNK